MIRYIFLTVIATLIVVAFYLLSVGASYNAGKQTAKEEFVKKENELEQLLEDYRVQLAEVRVERKLNRKNANRDSL